MRKTFLWVTLFWVPAAMAAGDVRVVVSSSAGDRLTEKAGPSFGAAAPAGVPVVTVDPARRYQTMEGFGATLTEAGLMVLNKLPAAEQEALLAALFSREKGAGFSLVKSPLAAFDFASAGPWYSYDDVPGDLGLTRFSIARDLGTNGLVTFIQRARRHGSFKIQSTMDYPPDWMLDAKQVVKPECYDALARYQLRYVQDYARQGITIDYLSPFNEPQYIYCKIPYRSIAVLIRDHLGPLFRKAGVPTKLQTSDSHNRNVGLKEFPGMLNDPAVRQYVSTISLHGYDWERQGSGAMAKLHEMYPDIPVWQTEVCYAKTIDKRPMPVFGFDDGDRWGRMIIADVNNWAAGWIYWNAILDQTGGPWLVSPVHGDPEDNPQHPVVIVDTAKKQTIYPGLYYYLAHFSKFVRPGAVRIGSAGEVPELSLVAFRDPGGARILEAVNSANAPRRFVVREGNRSVTLEQPARSIATYTWN